MHANHWTDHGRTETAQQEQHGQVWKSPIVHSKTCVSGAVAWVRGTHKYSQDTPLEHGLPQPQIFKDFKHCA